MSPSTCLQLLELEKAASLEDIKRAYRRLAQQVHPDKHGGDHTARMRFIEISNAYRTLMRSARAIERGKKLGVCQVCRAFGEVHLGLDGHKRCPDCVHRSARTRA